MTDRSSIAETYQMALLSQRLAGKHPLYAVIAGVDEKTSLLIAFLETLIEERQIEETPELRLFLRLANAKRMALFATSGKVNEITKMGLQMPATEEVIDFGSVGAAGAGVEANVQQG